MVNLIAVDSGRCSKIFAVLLWSVSVDNSYTSGIVLKFYLKNFKRSYQNTKRFRFQLHISLLYFYFNEVKADKDMRSALNRKWRYLPSSWFRVSVPCLMLLKLHIVEVRVAESWMAINVSRVFSSYLEHWMNETVLLQILKRFEFAWLHRSDVDDKQHRLWIGKIAGSVT